jgi:DNA polymerase I-like protein with 3'-5' exonuclease and polymerase domains
MVTIAFDTETWLIEPGLLAPPMICLQWAEPGVAPQMVHREHAEPVLRAWLNSDALLIGHNVAYDMGVIAAQFPHLLPLIFAKYDRDEIGDTLLAEQLIMIGRGTFKFQMGADQELHPVKYSLTECSARHFGRHLNKEGWRLFYRAFDAHPDVATWPAVATAFQAECRRDGLPDWAVGLVGDKDRDAMLAAGPDEAQRYALEDASTTLALYESQEKHFGPGGEDLLQDQFRQARAAFALHLCSAWGLYTDPEAVETLERELLQEYNALTFELQQAGVVRADGSADTKVAKAHMVAACEEEGIKVALTKGGDVSLGADACDRFDETTIIGQYSRFLTLRKTLSNDIKMLKAGAGDAPVQPRYDMADTGRTRASKPNIQAINRGAGIREAFRPREGTLFIQGDYEGLELHTRAAWCLEVIGWSKLADDLNAGLDVHSVVAADLLGMTYAEVKAGLKSADPDLKRKCKDGRQSAKALNFGLPGGLGITKFVKYARATYGVELTEDQAKEYKAKWMERQPEMVEFFALAAQATNNFAKHGDEDCLFVGRRGKNMRYSALCNRRFQALGADAAKEGLWRVTRACYADRESPLFGCRPVAFVHDEIIAEAPIARAAAAAVELGRLMVEGANLYLSRVPVRVVPQVMTLWSKNAEPVYDAEGALLPWSPPEKGN